MSINEAVIRGAKLRLWPVVMTSLTFVLGLLPAVLGSTLGSQAQRPLAIAVVGGMLVNMLLAQCLMPVPYTYFPLQQRAARHVSELAEGAHLVDPFLPELSGKGEQKP